MIKKQITALSDIIRNAFQGKPEPQPETSKKRISPKLKRNYQYRVELNLSQLKAAVDAAKAPQTPDRTLLYTIYQLISADSQLSSQIRTAKNTVIKSNFKLLDSDNKEHLEKTELLQTEWFDDFSSYCLDAEFWGHSLIEFGLLVNGEFKEVKLIPRMNVLPEKGMVALSPFDQKGIDYKNNLSQLALIEIGDPYSLGILELAAKEVIVKNYARTDWSQASEKYGMPLLKIRTDSQDDSELDRMEAQATSFASSGYVILNKEDNAEIIADSSTDRYKIYKSNIELCDKQISKLINGQGGTSDEKAFVGSAKVHERILSRYTISRLRRLQNIHNNKLIPLLIYFGYPLNGLKFQYLDLLKERPKMETSLDHEFNK